MTRDDWEKVSAVHAAVRAAEKHHDAGDVTKMRRALGGALWLLDELVELHGREWAAETKEAARRA